MGNPTPPPSSAPRRPPQEPDVLHLRCIRRNQAGAVKSFSALLSEFVERVGIPDADLARRMGVSRQTVFRWREGATRAPRRREDILRLASLLRLNSGERDDLLLAAGFPPEAEAPIRPTPSPDRADDHADAEPARQSGSGPLPQRQPSRFIPVCRPYAADPPQSVATRRCADLLDAAAHRGDLGLADDDFAAGRGRAVEIDQSQRFLAKSWSWLASLPITVGLRRASMWPAAYERHLGRPSRPQGWKISEWSCGPRQSGTRMRLRRVLSYLARPWWSGGSMTVGGS